MKLLLLAFATLFLSAPLQAEEKPYAFTFPAGWEAFVPKDSLCGKESFCFVLNPDQTREAAMGPLGKNDPKVSFMNQNLTMRRVINVLYLREGFTNPNLKESAQAALTGMAQALATMGIRLENKGMKEGTVGPYPVLTAVNDFVMGGKPFIHMLGLINAGSGSAVVSCLLHKSDETPLCEAAIQSYRKK